MTHPYDEDQRGQDMLEMEEERALAAEHQAVYREMCERLEAAKAAPPSPAVIEQHRAERRTLARVEAERRAIEDHQSSPQRDAERFGPKADPRWVLPDRPGQGWDDRIFGAGERAL